MLVPGSWFLEGVSLLLPADRAAKWGLNQQESGTARLWQAWDEPVSSLSDGLANNSKESFNIRSACFSFSIGYVKDF